MKKDFKNFLWFIFKLLNLPEPTEIQYAIADYLQHGSNPNRIIQAFRGVGKSYITAAFVVWKLWLNVDEKIVVISAGEDRAINFVKFVKVMLDLHPMLQALKPDTKSWHTDKANTFDINGSIPSGNRSITSLGIGGQMTGARATIMILDDIEIPKNSLTQGQREKLREAVRETKALLIPEAKPQIIYLGTPQTEATIYSKLYADGYDTRIWPARIPTEEQAIKYGAKLAPDIRNKIGLQVAGTTTEPRRFTTEYLMSLEVGEGRSWFALQYMLDPSMSDGLRHPLSCTDLIVYSSPMDKAPAEIYHSNNPTKILKLPEVGLEGQHYYSEENVSSDYLPYQASVMSIDPSGRGEDEMAYAVGKMVNGNIYCTKAGGLMGNGYSDENLTKLVEIAKANKVNKIIIESNFGDGMFCTLLRPYLDRSYPCIIEEVRNNKQKEARIIDVLEPVINQHRLILDPSVIQEDYDSAINNYPGEKAHLYMLMYQLARISREKGSLKHDDRLDALAIMVGYFNTLLGVDQEMQSRRIKQETLNDFLNKRKRFFEGTLNSKPSNTIKLWSRLGRK